MEGTGGVLDSLYDLSVSILLLHAVSYCARRSETTWDWMSLAMTRPRMRSSPSGNFLLPSHMRV